jgi:hypothetical protein
MGGFVESFQVPSVDNTEFLMTARRYPAEASGWSLSAASDFFTASDFLRKVRKCKGDSAEHMGLLLGAVIAYARPFTDITSRTFNQPPEQRQCFMGIAADLGADIDVHVNILLAREKLIGLSDYYVPGSEGLAGPRRHWRKFVYPNPRCARILDAIERGDFRRNAALMRLACVFFLAEVARDSYGMQPACAR